MPDDRQPKRLRVGLVGAGGHAHRNILPTLTYLPVELVAVADPREAHAAETARRWGAERHFASAQQMYEWGELDAALLVVSPEAHPDLAMAAFRAGLDVWMEKPAAASSAQLEAMLGERGDRVAVVGYKKAFEPAAQKVRELLSMPEVGRLWSASGTYPVELPLRTGRPPFPVSEWLTSGCHSLSLLISIAGPVSTVASFRPGRGSGGVVILEHAGGVVSALHAAKGAPKFQPSERYGFVTELANIEIVNTRRVVYQRGFQVDYAEDATFAPPGLDGGAIVWEAQDTMATLQGKNVVTQGIFGGLQAFCEAVATRENPRIGSLEFALDVTRVYEAAQISDGDRVATDPARNAVQE